MSIAGYRLAAKARDGVADRIDRQEAIGRRFIELQERCKDERIKSAGGQHPSRLRPGISAVNSMEDALGIPRTLDD